jgi:hypothetical protein
MAGAFKMTPEEVASITRVRLTGSLAKYHGYTQLNRGEGKDAYHILFPMEHGACCAMDKVFAYYLRHCIQCDQIFNNHGCWTSHLTSDDHIFFEEQQREDEREFRVLFEETETELDVSDYEM